MELINSNNFNDTINSNSVTIVDVYADWCGPCKMISPLLEQLSSELTNVKFVKLDADADGELVRSFGIQSIPTILFFKNGELKQKLIGFQPKDRLKSLAESLL